jgi:transglutaminase-like putative cysteine protease
VGALAVATATCLGVAGQAAARGQLSPTAGTVAGVGVGLLAVLGLPSLSLRLVARVLVGVSAVVMVRFGVVGGSLVGGGQLLLAWLVAAVAVLVLTDRLGADLAAVPGGEIGRRSASRPLPTARAVLTVAALLVVGVLILAPLVLPHLSSSTYAGAGPELDPRVPGAGSLRSSASLDMTTRPDLTDRVVFTVDAARGTFWRGETFDVWDGRRWSRSDPWFVPLAGERVAPAADDLGARGTDEVVQRFHIEASYAEVIYAAPSAVRVQAPVEVRQRPDGTVVSAPMGRGAVYTVTSRRQVLSEARLRAVDGEEVPIDVRRRYAEPPVATDRVRAAARQATAGARTAYDKVRAIEAWMGRRTEYSLDAPLAPQGVDVVDHFLFGSRRGWCEQIASSLVVLARLNGLPARLVTGFVPGEHDAVTGSFTVRERDAHAWAEVWFPEVGWVPFDPTANVPLAGSDAPAPTWGRWLLDHALALALAGAGVAVAAGPLRRWVAARLAARRARPRDPGPVLELRLERLGRKLERPRGPAETATAYGVALAAVAHDDRLVAVGRLLDDARYAPVPPPDEDLARAGVVVDELLGVGSPGP